MERHGRRSQAVTIRRGIVRFLEHQPTERSPHRQPIAANPFGVEWEWRLGNLRAFYDVLEAEGEVRVERAGYKEGNDLYVRGEKIDLRSEE